MVGEAYINNVNLNDYKDSYTLRCVIESVFSEFYRSDIEGKKVLLERLDKELSQKLKMYEANFIFEDNENTLDCVNIYFGSLSKIKSPFELLGRYFFEKRQQYQRICIQNNDKGSFSEEDFSNLKCAYDKLPVSRREMYIPYSKGLEEYLLNYNKLDAILYMLDNVLVVSKIVDVQKLFNNVGYNYSKKIAGALNKFKKDSAVIINTMEKIGDFSQLLERKTVDFRLKFVFEHFVLSNMISQIFEMKSEPNVSVLLIFNENVWSHINADYRKQFVEMCNEYIAYTMGVDSKTVSFDKGANSYNFVKNDVVHVGNVEEISPYMILVKLVYEYGFDCEYEEIFKSNKKDVNLKEYEKCKELYLKTQSYDEIKKYEFIKHTRMRILMSLNRIYNLINNNLYMDGNRIPMTISKNEFVVDLFKPRRRR